MSTLFQKNVEYHPPLALSSFRKIALGTWRTSKDPSVYCVIELDAGPASDYIEKIRTQSAEKITLTHLVGKAVATTFARHPKINCVLRFGRLYPRKSVDVSFLVASDDAGKDLSSTIVRNAERKTVTDIAKELRERVKVIREKDDPDYRQIKSTMKLVPGWLTGWLLDFTSFIMYSLNLWSPLLGAPRDSFGSVMVSNIGSIGLDLALVPLVPYSRVPMLLAVGAVRDTPAVEGGRVVVRPKFNLCITFDHRLIDGVYASKLAHTFQEIFADPEKELGSL